MPRYIVLFKSTILGITKIEFWFSSLSQNSKNLIKLSSVVVKTDANLLVANASMYSYCFKVCVS